MNIPWKTKLVGKIISVKNCLQKMYSYVKFNKKIELKKMCYLAFYVLANIINNAKHIFKFKQNT